MKVHVIPRPDPDSSDPALDVVMSYAWRAATALLLLFIALRLAGVTDWQWWAVLLPLIATLGGFILAVVIMIGWVLLWAKMGDG